MSRMTIKNEIWTPQQLLENIKYIKKPKFNRDKVWSRNALKNKDKANFEEFLNFLFKTKNSVTAISLGVNYTNSEKNWLVIDGNNRINSIIEFLKNPYSIFSRYYEDLFSYIKENLEVSICEKITNTIKNLTYKQLSTFRRLDDYIDDDIIIDRKLMRNIENKLIDVQKKLISNDGVPYDQCIKLVINELENGNNNEYCKIFEDINKYSNTLSPNELLAAMLFETTITINDNNLRNDIINKIKEYYDNRGQDEVLETFKINLDYNMNITAYDFMVGLQNYCYDKYSIVPNFSHEGTSIFFKIFGYLYGSLDKDRFTVENVNDFINKILFSCSIVTKAYQSIMPVNLNDNYFNKTSRNNFSGLIAKNPMTILFISNIYNKNKISEKELINCNRIVIIYHLLCDKKYLKGLNEEEIKCIKTYDNIEYTAGGSYIDNLCKTILNGDKNIFDISKEIFAKLLKYNLLSSLNEKSHEDERKTNKRRQLNMFDKILISNYYNKKMSNYYLDKVYSIEHITPYSSSWNDNIDINRLGNLFPTLDYINKMRGNKNLDIYYEDKNKEFTTFINDLLPKNYNNINIRDSKKTIITSNELYNSYCSHNEYLYIKTLIEDIYTN